jgi:hypothetical protein
MAARNDSRQNASSAEDLRQVFETAVVEIHQPDLIKRRLPIVQRPRQAAALHCQDGREKRAVSDAAQALAQLWKLSPFSAR